MTPLMQASTTTTFQTWQFSKRQGFRKDACGEPQAHAFAAPGKQKKGAQLSSRP